MKYTIGECQPQVNERLVIVKVTRHGWFRSVERTVLVQKGEDGHIDMAIYDKTGERVEDAVRDLLQFVLSMEKPPS